MDKSIIATNLISSKKGQLYLGKTGYFTDLELDNAQVIEHNYSKPVYNPLQVFPTMKKYVVQLKRQELELWKNKKQPYEMDDWFGEWQWDECTEHIEKLSKEIKFLTRKDRSKAIKNQEELLQNAKAVKINDIIGVPDDGHLQQFIKCPLHTEKTASLCIYKETNSWHCFGCSEGSDSVDLYMKLNKVSFQEAIKELNK